MWQLHNTHVTNTWIKEILREIFEYFKLKGNKNINICGIQQNRLRGQCIALNTFIRRE